MKEIWKNINGYKYYQVSNLGRIKTLSRKDIHKRKNQLIVRHKKEKRIKGILKSSGYIQVNLFTNSKQYKCELVHRLVGKAFIKNFANKPMINHKDGNKQNNIISNLEWCNLSENIIHSYNVLGAIPHTSGKIGVLHPKSKAVLQKKDGKIIKRWDCASDAVREFGFDSGGITKACKGINKQHKGYEWEYEKTY